MHQAWLLLSLVLGLKLRPYVPPALEPEPAFVAAPVAVVEIVPPPGEWDTAVFVRPNPLSPLIGSVARGARVKVRGQFTPPSARYCPSGVYFTLEPAGWICSTYTRPTSEPVSTEPVLAPLAEVPVPYRYAMVNVEEGQTVPMYASIEDARTGGEPERQLERGDTVAMMPAGSDQPSSYAVGEERYRLTADNKVVPYTGTYEMKSFSDWEGVAITPTTHLPFGWVTTRKASVLDAPGGKEVSELERRARVDIVGEHDDGKTRWLKLAEGQFIKASLVNEVRAQPRPEGTGSHPQWIDVDLGEQVVVAYQNGQAVFATLTSSGRPPNRTPRGNYPVWGKASAITMKSQQYDDKAYYVNRVPWVLFFQAHNALHAAYWHDRFGTVKSHGCANLSPKDARRMFEWLEPKLPGGWTAMRYWDLTKAPVVHVRDSSRTQPFVQDRNIGPPDKDDEAKRVEAAIARREQEAAKLAADQAAGLVPPGTVLPPGTTLPPATVAPSAAAAPLAPAPAAPRPPVAPTPVAPLAPR